MESLIGLYNKDLLPGRDPAADDRSPLDAGPTCGQPRGG